MAQEPADVASLDHACAGALAVTAGPGGGNRRTRRRAPRRALGLAAAVAVMVAACGDDGDAEPAPTTEATTGSTSEETSTSIPADGTLDEVSLTVQEVASVESPTALVARPGTVDLYVAEQEGRVRVIEVTEASAPGDAPDYRLESTPVLDISEQVVAGGEQGLLGLAFSTDGRALFVSYTEAPDGTSVVARYELGDRSRLDVESRRELLRVEQPFPNHNGGHLVTGPDGYLYIGLGDGGGRGDPDGNGQDPTTLMGSILRVDPEGGSDDGPAYGIPPGNPFADRDEGAPEVWLYGVRNPWRFSFDDETGDLWVADVGQEQWEEVDRLPAVNGFDAGRGANLGWAEMEGTHAYDGGENPEGAVLPIHEYRHDDGACSITGGFVYRGEAIPALAGAYVFGDYCAPGLRGIQVEGDAVIDERTWDVPVEGVQSFGQDADGELFVLLGGGPVLKVVPG